MNTLRQQERQLLKSLCDKYNLPSDLINILVKTAEKHMYENVSSSEKRTDYINLVTYHSKGKELH
ncbi:DNA modification system-associated small protein [Paenibacillus mangrovi]|uniref:DNA modification system-associated small protein n=1 Tax=Paenibacillus mangrovi TaxID=2931978 RepID=UPI003CC80E4A